MPKVCDPAVVERARVLVEGSARTLGDIAREVGVSLQSVRNWIDRYGWRRYPLARRAVPKLTPEKEGPARRLYEGGARVDDLGPLLSCHPSYVHKLARQRGWAKPGTGGAKAEGSGPSPALMAIVQEACTPGMTRAGLADIVVRATGLLWAEMLTSNDPGIPDRLDAVSWLGEHLHLLPEDAPPAPRRLSPAEEQARVDAEIEELVWRFASPEERAERDAAAARAAAGGVC
jgi:transposase-like protein